MAVLELKTLSINHIDSLHVVHTSKEYDPVVEGNCEGEKSHFDSKSKLHQAPLRLSLSLNGFDFS